MNPSERYSLPSAVSRVGHAAWAGVLVHAALHERLESEPAPGQEGEQSEKHQVPRK